MKHLSEEWTQKKKTSRISGIARLCTSVGTSILFARNDCLSCIQSKRRKTFVAPDILKFIKVNLHLFADRLGMEAQQSVRFIQPITAVRQFQEALTNNEDETGETTTQPSPDLPTLHQSPFSNSHYTGDDSVSFNYSYFTSSSSLIPRNRTVSKKLQLFLM